MENMSNSALEPQEAFENQANHQNMELSCVFRNAENFKRSYLCEITDANITKPGTVIKSVKGAHQEGKGNGDVEVLLFNSLTVENFPRGLPNIFPNLIQLVINKCGLKNICREDLVGFEGLEKLDLSINQLDSLPDNLFVGMKKLEDIDFSFNKITKPSSKLLKPIENHIKVADFTGNTKINEIYNNHIISSSLTDLKKQLDKCHALSDAQNNTSGFSFKDTLVNCDKLKGFEFNQPRVDRNRDSFESLCEKFELMWTTGKYSDFAVIAGEREFKVHKSVLGWQSSRFEEIFDQSKEENLKIENFGAEQVEEFLQFFYTCKDPSKTNAIEVYKLAATYKVSKLKELCEKIIIENITSNNVVEVVQLANLHKCTEMKNSAISVVKTIIPGEHLNESVFDNCELLEKIIKANDFINSHRSKSASLSVTAQGVGDTNNSRNENHDAQTYRQPMRLTNRSSDKRVKGQKSGSRQQSSIFGGAAPELAATGGSLFSQSSFLSPPSTSVFGGSVIGGANPSAQQFSTGSIPAPAFSSFNTQKKSDFGQSAFAKPVGFGSGFGQQSFPVFGTPPAAETSLSGVSSPPQQQEFSTFGQPQQQPSIFGGQRPIRELNQLSGSDRPNNLRPPFSLQLLSLSPHSLDGLAINTAGGGLFRSTTTNAFGQQATALHIGTAIAKFQAQQETVPFMIGSQTSYVQTKQQCITFMKEYEKKSLEELRLEDYAANRKGPQPSSGSIFGGGSTQSAFGSSNEAPRFPTLSVGRPRSEA